MPAENYLCEENLESGGVHSSREVFHEYRDLRCKLKEGKACLGMLAIRRGLRLDFHRIAFFRYKKISYMRIVFDSDRIYVKQDYINYVQINYLARKNVHS